VRLRIDLLHVVTMLAVVTAALSVYAAPAQPLSDGRAALTLGRSEIGRALETVKADPNLAPEQTIKTLRWRNATERRPFATPSWLRWIAGLFHWLDQSARVLVWVAVAALAGVLVIYLTRTVRNHRAASDEDTFVAPTHVRDLDIRPESLPKDVGVAARLLWDRGAHRMALALLYRGMLSQLAHVYAVPIRDSSTEGDCLVLATKHLPAERLEYASQVVRVWQRFVYGGQDTPAATVYGLCDQFASSLDHASPFDPMRAGTSI
jgi:uncharacterized protein DUF4129